ncbi:SCO-spondin-like [Haliotis rufescens]|uniref:SCO-spondin-like n=1 Tax=Haliotis rufescens TaxID=6454 RepID=UPI00201EFA4C|nr:SCO-spondin-like [Haliotis rufescens]
MGCFTNVVFVASIVLLSTLPSKQQGNVRSRRATACDVRYSSLRADHTMCLTDSPVATPVILTPQQQQDIVDRHNYHRANTPGASSMLAVVWDEDIAVVAAKWARQCTNGHESTPLKRSIPTLPGISLGQNVGSGWPSFLSLITDGWYAEVAWFRYGVGSVNGSDVRHYTQITNDFVSRIGCGQAMCSFQGFQTPFYVCNYARGQGYNELSKPYCSSSDPAAICPVCLSTTSQGLCDCSGKVCMNSGNLDQSRCQCQCPTSGYFTGASCETLACPSVDRPFCSDPRLCEVYTNFPYDCPNLCGTCPRTCNKVCENGGTQNTMPCLCHCPPGYTGDLCQTPVSASAVNGGWGQWGAWNTASVPCPVSCGNLAYKTTSRTRVCDSPAPSDGGRECVGEARQARQESCRLTTPCPVNGGLSLWSAWDGSQCTRTCGMLVTRIFTRTRSCTAPSPQFGGADCAGTVFETALRNCGLSECPIAGNVTEWSEWTGQACSVTCGQDVTRTLVRTRTCNNPRPAFGGADCTDALFDTKQVNCNLRYCPIDGGISTWEQWTTPPCPLSCGVSAHKVVTRNRSCSNPPPQYGGRDCAEPRSETALVNCNNRVCPGVVDGGVTDWGAWIDSACPVTCGLTAVRNVSRTRTCTRPPPQNGGRDCLEPLLETYVRGCQLRGCPVDGGFTQWGQWANPPCSVTCGSRATKNVSRVRSCSNPIPQNGGTFCTGNSSETEERNCGLPPCTDGGFTQWGQWANPPCSVTCGSRATKNVSRVRSCSNPIPQNGGTFCTGNNSETEERNCGLPPCTVDGGFTQWGPWANPPCSVTCGSRATKNVSRVRSCSNPIPQNGGIMCTGNNSETEERNCGLPPCTVDGGFTQWGQWANPPCSVTCGSRATKNVSRVRSCSNPIPQNGGIMCTGNNSETEERNCGLPPCTVDGGFTQWGQWANPPCSVTCGSRATKNVSRVRSCSNPIPQNGGIMCTGNNSETEERNCGLPPCTETLIYRLQ